MPAASIMSVGVLLNRKRVVICKKCHNFFARAVNQKVPANRDALTLSMFSSLSHTQPAKRKQQVRQRALQQQQQQQQQQQRCP